MAIKRIKDAYKIVRGQVTGNTYSGTENKIHLFDGKFTTGWKLVSFKIAPKAPLDASNTECILSTEPKSTLGSWDWGDVQEIAWATWHIGAGYDGSLVYSNIADDNLIIQDLWIRAYDAGEAKQVNYEIELEKYDISSWDGAAALVRNNAQSGP